MQNIVISIYDKDKIADRDHVILYLCSDFALSHGLNPPTEVFRSSGKKPYLDSDDIFFSVSHSENIWACAVSDGKIGIDLQFKKSCKSDLIARKFYYPHEAAWCKNDLDRFFAVWTAKESYVKFTGDGIDENFKKFSVLDTENKIKSVNNTILTEFLLRDDCFLSVCSQSAPNIEIKNRSLLRLDKTEKGI